MRTHIADAEMAKPSANVPIRESASLSRVKSCDRSFDLALNRSTPPHRTKFREARAPAPSPLTSQNRRKILLWVASLFKRNPTGLVILRLVVGK
jgi:hypothetical protein